MFKTFSGQLILRNHSRPRDTKQKQQAPIPQESELVGDSQRKGYRRPVMKECTHPDLQLCSLSNQDQSRLAGHASLPVPRMHFLLHVQLPMWLLLPSSIYFCIWHFSKMEMIAAFVLSTDLLVLGLLYNS